MHSDPPNALQEAAAALHRRAYSWAVHFAGRGDLSTVCASCAFLAFVECGGTDLQTFDWSDPTYKKTAHRILVQQIRGRASDRFDERSRQRSRPLVNPPEDSSTCGSWTARGGVRLADIEAKDAVEFLRTHLSPADFQLLDVLCMQGRSLQEYAPIWAMSGQYRGKHSGSHAENALSKRFRAALRAARRCLAEAY